MQGVANMKRGLENLLPEPVLTRFLEKWEKEPKELRQMLGTAAREMAEFNKSVIRYAVDGEYISKEAGEAINSYLYFIPFWRVSDNYLKNFLSERRPRGTMSSGWLRISWRAIRG